MIIKKITKRCKLFFWYLPAWLRFVVMLPLLIVALGRFVLSCLWSTSKLMGSSVVLMLQGIRTICTKYAGAVMDNNNRDRMVVYLKQCVCMYENPRGM